MDTLLTLNEISAGYTDVWAVREISLEVPAGRVACLLGPNGAGKTTLLRAISGVAPRASGEVVLGGVRVDTVPAYERVRRGLVHVPEGRRNLIPTLTVADNLRLAGLIADRYSLAQRQQLVFDTFPVLAERRGQHAGTLSGGQQQMLAIALGLVCGPRVLVVDEPSAGLSPVLVDELFEQLAALSRTGIAMLVAEQRVDLALEVSEYGYVMESGELVAEGTPRQLSRSKSLVESYLGGV